MLSLKRFVILTLLLWPIGANAANYEEALQLVRTNKFVAAKKEFELLAAEGHAPSLLSLGLIYHLGRGVKKDPAMAYEFYKKAALLDHAPALNNVGVMYLNGDYVAQNREVAFRLFQKASTTFGKAMDNLGQCFENGWGTQKNIVRAKEMYQLAGESGVIKSWHRLGQVYETDQPFSPKDIEKAVEWYIKAAEQKYLPSIKRLTRLKRLPEELAPK